MNISSPTVSSLIIHSRCSWVKCIVLDGELSWWPRLGCDCGHRLVFRAVNVLHNNVCFTDNQHFSYVISHSLIGFQFQLKNDCKIFKLLVGCIFGQETVRILGLSFLFLRHCSIGMPRVKFGE